jgi:simple sugar transport system substrate-binding protein
VAGFAPLDRRDAVWRDFKRAHPNVQEKARWGTVDNPIAQSVANQASAAYRAHPDIRVGFAPYDEFARDAKLAADEAMLSSKLRIYSEDISTADIEAIRAPGGAWVATGATNPAVVGAVSVRAAALLVAGQDPGYHIVVKPTLITRDDLVKNDIKTIADLGAKFPAFRSSDAAGCVDSCCAVSREERDTGWRYQRVTSNRCKTWRRATRERSCCFITVGKPSRRRRRKEAGCSCHACRFSRKMAKPLRWATWATSPTGNRRWRSPCVAPPPLPTTSRCRSRRAKSCMLLAQLR